MHIVIIGCGVIGAAIAYELSQTPDLDITVIDRQPPAQASTGAALGVLMGIISQKIKGKAWKMRYQSIEAYNRWVPEIEEMTRTRIPFNRQGILMLLTQDAPEQHWGMDKWQELAKIRQTQGWNLETWDGQKLGDRCPHLASPNIIGAVYSPEDRQLDPIALTRGLIATAQYRGVTTKFGVEASKILTFPNGKHAVVVDGEEIFADWIIIAAGLGSSSLTAGLQQHIDIRPVLGQAIQVSLGHPLGNSEFQPAITANDVHIVPCHVGISLTTDYWIGATVEFANEQGEIPNNPDLLASVYLQAISLCPELEKAEITNQWSGLRPRPERRPAPIIDKLPNSDRILVASGHYRNGVLLAPATAIAIREMIFAKEGSGE